MRKLVSFFILAAMMLMFVACTGDVTPTDVTQTPTQPNIPTTAPTEPATTAPTEPAHEHVWVDATCDTPKTCSECEATEGVANGHTWTEATCTAAKTCSACGAIEGQPKDHSWDEGTVTVEATEETTGEELFTCLACGETKTVIIPELSHEHSYSATVTDPTCTEEGYTTFVCRCGDTYIDDEKTALGHSWNDATCTQSKTCNACGETEGSALGHDHQLTAAKEPTCTAEGSKTYTCSRCSDSYSETIAKLDHDYAAATCTAPKTCKACGKTEGSALGHDHQLTATKEPTCTAEGSKTYTCSRCSDSYSETIAKLDHDYAAATCTSPKTCKACGKTEGSALGHDHKVTASKEPTCTAEGSKTYTCSRCSDSYSETVAKVDHNFAAATCTAPATCSYCGITSGSAAGHSWEPASCTKPKTCSRCFLEEGEPLDHDWCIVSCESWEQCSRCSEYGGEYIHHDWDENYICTICLCPQCETYGHYYFWGRCYYCHGYDEESTAMAEALLPSIITSDMSEYEKVKALHDYIINNTQYDYENYLNGTIPDSSYSAVGVFQYGVAVCQGYAYAFELLCELAGIECELVTGTANGGGHAWNQVKVDGKWYNIDLTWDDPIYYYNGVLTPILVYDYFLISDEQMYLDHVANDAQHVCDESYPMP